MGETFFLFYLKTETRNDVRLASFVYLSLSLSFSQARDSLPLFIERAALPINARPPRSPPGKNAQENKLLRSPLSFATRSLFLSFSLHLSLSRKLIFTS